MPRSSPPLPELPRELTLRDGTRVVVRRIEKDDADRLRTGMKLLSPQSRYLRFHTAMDELPEKQARWLADVDHVTREAIGAEDPARPDLPGVGVARFDVDTHEPTIAEAAVVVIDEYQGRGLGSGLMTILAVLAHEQGVRTLRNYVLAENADVLALLDRIGCRRTSLGGGVERVEIDLPDELPDSGSDILPTTATELLRAVARGEVPTIVEPGSPDLDAWLDVWLEDHSTS
ncbi:MAG: GNAT family N-acetyltransferase [Nitriliruptorales bacterium]|nr:GNAT family N-acetyltransferase [Nitriliruptorales bacterium]